MDVQGSGETASGTLRVTAYVQSSIQLTTGRTDGGDLVAGGHREATVTIPIVLHGGDSAQATAAEGFPLTTVSRVANLPNSNGYTLEATWVGSEECIMKIDGVTVVRGVRTDITEAKVMGDPYGRETEHRILVVHSSRHNSGFHAGTLTLTARPKMM